MQISAVPTKIDIIWASGADSSHVRVIPDTTSDPNAASWTLGSPPNTFVDPGAGGEPPNGEDYNGALKMLSAWTNWQNAGGPIFYDSAFSASVGGYPKWAVLANASTVGLFWISQVDNNTSDPDTGGANWMQFPPMAAAAVSSFNTRTGAVVLSSADVVSALAANALANAKLALMTALTVKANPTNSPATPQDVPLSALALLLAGSGNLATTGHATLPLSVGGVLRNLIINWGNSAPNTFVTFDQPYTTSFFGGVGSTNVAGTPVEVNGGTLTGMNVFAGGGTTNVFWISIGF